MREFHADLHIHSCLSPCASLNLSPKNIVERARAEGLDILAITDHNSAKNAGTIRRLGEKAGIQVLPGMEVQTREEIHLLTLFPDAPASLAWSQVVDRFLPGIKNEPEVFGDQPIVDEQGEILGFEERLLLNSVDLPMVEVQNRVALLGGLTIPSHYDRGPFSLINQLGFMPEDFLPDALEVTHTGKGVGRESWTLAPASIPRIICSDAHEVEDIGKGRTVFLLDSPTLQEIRYALHGEKGRKIVRMIFQRQDIYGPSPQPGINKKGI